MIDGLKPYPEYRESGVAWLGEVPAHWPLLRMKSVLRERSEKGHPQEPLLAATQSKGVVRKEVFENRTVVAMKDLHLLKLVRIGDFVISLRSFQGGIEYAREQGIISPAYTVLTTRDPGTQPYLSWLLKSRPFIEGLSLFVTGIRQGQNIDYERLSRSEIPIPPGEERDAIVRFLNHADRRIRRYIRAKQKLIKLLEEQQSAIIRGCVSRGLDISGQLKPSGVEWLGTIPQHWAVRRLRFIAHIKTGERDTIQARADGAYPFFVRSQKVERIDSYSYDGEAVLTAGDGAGVAKVFHYVDGKFDYHQRVYKFSKFREVLGRYFFYYVQLFLGAEVLKLSAKSTVDSLRLPMLQNFPVVVPPPGEQRAIIAAIEAELGPRDTAIAAARRELSLLREYRTRLIAEVVTGKLDVREAAARLPDVLDEEPAPDALDEDATSLDGDGADAEALDPELQEA